MDLPVNPNKGNPDMRVLRLSAGAVAGMQSLCDWSREANAAGEAAFA